MKKLTLMLILVGLLPDIEAAGQTARMVGVRDAIESAVASNLTTKLAVAAGDSARARVLQAASALLPNLLAAAYEQRIFRTNLAAQGLTQLGPFPPTIGPFNSFDARVRLTQPLFDLSAIRRYRAAGAGKTLADRAETLAREQVAAAAALSYIEAVRSQKAVAASQADVDLAERLLKLAQNRHTQGTASGLDVVRANTRLSDAQVALLRTQVVEREAAIRLRRITGWPPTLEFSFKDDLTPDAPALSPIDDSLAAAAAARPEIQVASEQLRVDDELLKAAMSERAPSLAVLADYGLSGNNPDSSALGTGSIGAGISVPLFSGGIITAHIREARSARQSSEVRLADIRIQVDEDVRLAYENCGEARNEVAGAAKTVELARQELKMTEDRFAAGTGDNVEVVTAQAELARARDGYVAALSRHQAARVNLATASGRAQAFSL